MGSQDTISLILLAQLIVAILGVVFSAFAHQEAGDKRPCMAKNRLTPNILATLSMWKDCLRTLCSACSTNKKMKVPGIHSGNESGKEF